MSCENRPEEPPGKRLEKPSGTKLVPGNLQLRAVHFKWPQNFKVLNFTFLLSRDAYFLDFIQERLCLFKRCFENLGIRWNLFWNKEKIGKVSSSHSASAPSRAAKMPSTSSRTSCLAGKDCKSHWGIQTATWYLGTSWNYSELDQTVWTWSDFSTLDQVWAPDYSRL